MSNFLEKVASQWMFFTEKREKNTAKRDKNKPKRSRFLYHEPLEERLPVSASILGLAAGAAFAGGGDTTYTDTTQNAEYRSGVNYESGVNYANDTASFDALSELHLDALSAQLGIVDTEESTDDNAYTSRANDVTPEITSDFNTESSVDLTQKFGDDLPFIQDELLNENFYVDTFDCRTDTLFNIIGTNNASLSASASENANESASMSIGGANVTLSDEVPINRPESNDDFYQRSAEELGYSELPNFDASDDSVASYACGPTGTATITNASLGSGTLGASYCSTYSQPYLPVDRTAHVFQNGNTASVPASFLYSACSYAGKATIIVEASNGSNQAVDYWNTIAFDGGSHTFVWTLPTGITNKDAVRDFTFTYFVDKNDDQKPDANEAQISLNVHICSVDLDVDSDNNGCINTVNKVNGVSNGNRERAEDGLEDTAGKPITFFGSKTGVTEDYVYVPIGTFNSIGNLQGVKFSLHYTTNLEVYKKTGNQYELIPSNYKYTIADLKSEYYVKAVGSSSDTGFASGIDKIHLVLWNSNDNEIARDTVCFKVQDNSGGNWVVPPGWKINGADGFTTPMPVAGAIGPANEGSLPKSVPSDLKGDACTVGTYANGFTLTFNYSFERNGDNGYLQADTNANEIIDTGVSGCDQKKISFVGNSGVKIGGASGVPEIQILDIVKMVDLIGGAEQGRLDRFVSKIEFDTIKGVYGPYLKLDGYEPELLSTIIPGIVYKFDICSSDNFAMLDANLGKSVEVSLKTNTTRSIEYYRELFKKVYDQFNNAGTTITVSRSVGGILSVNLGDKLIFEQANIPAGDGKVYLQSHWGSGVTFSGVSVV